MFQVPFLKSHFGKQVWAKGNKNVKESLNNSQQMLLKKTLKKHTCMNPPLAATEGNHPRPNRTTMGDKYIIVGEWQ